MFVSALNGAENIPLFENIIIVLVSFDQIPSTSIQRYRQSADQGQLLDSNNTNCILYAIQCRALVPCSFDLFWTTLHQYVTHKSLRWRCTTLRTQARNLWGNPCTRRSFTEYSTNLKEFFIENVTKIAGKFDLSF